MHIHVVAVAGTGMGALAGLLRQLGHEVSGSDVRFDPPIGPALERWGVRCLQGFEPAHLEPAPELVVIGNVCRADNPEARAAIDRGLEVTHIAGALQRFALEGTAPLVVAGTHGKTTTTALAAFLLDRAGFAPGFLIGGLPRDYDESFRAAQPSPRQLGADGLPRRRTPFVIEGDEYDTAFFEKSPKFVHYRAEVAIVTSIEHDHVDIYPSMERYLDAFERFVRGIPERGLIVANATERHVVEIVSREARAPVAWYALEDQEALVPAQWIGAPAEQGPRETSFELFVGGVRHGRLLTPLAGRHNLGNTVAALAAVVQGYGARLDQLGKPLAEFGGVRRRQELIGDPRGVQVYDDFAHHPTAVRETLAALRARHPQGHLIAVFEPRSATACRRLHQEAYATAFDAADEVVLAPLGRQNLPPAERLDLGRLVEALEARGKTAVSPGSVDEIVAHLARRAEPGDTVALLSNGAFGEIHGKVLEALARDPAPRT